MFLKTMSNQDLPDVHGAKQYRIVECKEVQFLRTEVLNEDGTKQLCPMAYVDGEQLFLQGNAYILNNSGKTIDAFAHTDFAVPPLAL